MSIVFVLPLSLGLYALALDLPVSIDEAYAGLIMPASAFVMMGKSGAHRGLLVLFGGSQLVWQQSLCILCAFQGLSL